MKKGCVNDIVIEIFLKKKREEKRIWTYLKKKNNNKKQIADEIVIEMFHIIKKAKRI